MSEVVRLKRLVAVDPTPAAVEQLAWAQLMLERELRMRGELLAGVRQ